MCREQQFSVVHLDPRLANEPAPHPQVCASDPPRDPGRVLSMNSQQLLQLCSSFSL